MIRAYTCLLLRYTHSACLVCGKTPRVRSLKSHTVSSIDRHRITSDIFLSGVGLIWYAADMPNNIRVIKSRRLRWAGHVARTGECRDAYRALVGKPEGRGSLERPRRRWEDTVKVNLGEVGWGHIIICSLVRLCGSILEILGK
jgi:hypothetical protein